MLVLANSMRGTALPCAAVAIADAAFVSAATAIEAVLRPWHTTKHTRTYGQGLTAWSPPL